MASSPYATAHGIASVQVAETDVAAVTAGGSEFGWVSGSPANLAVNVQAIVIFDLGPLWFRYTVVALSIRPSTVAADSLKNIFILGNDTPAASGGAALRDVCATSAIRFFASCGNSTEINPIVRPMGRYVLIGITNGDPLNAQLANAKITLAAYPS